MTRLLASSMILLLLAAPCRATSYRDVSLAELVGTSDAVVVGTLLDVDASTIRVKVIRSLAGKVKRQVSLPAGRTVVENPGRLRVGDTWVFFLASREQQLTLVYDMAFVAETNANEVRLLIAMRADPKKYLSDPRQGSSLAFLELLSFVFAKRQRVADLDRAAVIKHFEDHLGSPQSRTVLLVLEALKRVGSKQSAKVVIPLLRHADRDLRRAAAQFLGWARDRTAVKPLCEALDTTKEDKDLAGCFGGALGRIQDPNAAPALVRAVQRDVEGPTCWALGCLGDESSFQPLLDLVERRKSMEALSALMTLVKRSNKQYESWMDLNRFHMNGDDQRLEWNRDDWRKWWTASKADFKVTKTAAEVFGWDQGKLKEGPEERDEGLEWSVEPAVEENDTPLERLFSTPVVAATLGLLPPAFSLLALILALSWKDRRWVLVLATAGATLGAFALAAGMFGGTMMRLGNNFVIAAGGGGLILGVAAGALAGRRKEK